MHSTLTRLLTIGAVATGVGWLSYAGPASAAETLKLDLRDVRNEAPVKSVKNVPSTVQSGALTAGVGYVITVSGTGSIWVGTAWGATSCGAAEQRPMEPSPGAKPTLAGWDAATVFAAPFGVNLGPVGKACQGLQVPLGSGKNVYAGFEFTVGAKYDRQAPYGGFRSVPRSDHTYSYLATGQGLPARFRFVDAPAKDNSGVFTITVRTEAECAAIQCLALAGPESDQLADPAVPAAASSVKVSGRRTCSSKKQSLRVRVVPPTGLRFRKEVFYIGGKKTRVVAKKLLKIKKAGRRLPTETFVNVPHRTFKLKVKVTTTVGQRLVAVRTVKKCTVGSKKSVVF